MSDIGYKAGEASVWVQTGGPNTKPQYLGCHEVGDVAEPQGDITRLFCPDASAMGKFKVVGSFQGQADPPTVTLTTTVSKTADYLERVRCPVNVFVHKGVCGRRDVFTSYERSFVFHNGMISNRGLTALGARTPDAEGESMQSFDLSGEDLQRVLTLTAARQANAGVRDLLAILFFNDIQCAGACGARVDAGTEGVAVGQGDYAAKGVLLWTADGGGTWTASAADPFAVAEDISSVVAFSINGTTKRVLVARGTADGAAPAEVAYTDNLGATWTLANVGSTNGQYVRRAQGMFALDQYHIWLVTNDGYIYLSEDGGVTWSAQESGALAATGWNAIQFIDELDGWVAGNTNEIAVTADGGVTWTAVTGPAAQAARNILTMAVVNEYEIWFGYSDGEIWYTMNGGDTILQRAIPAAATVDFIAFANELDGFALINSAAPVGSLLRTIDGGYTWQATDMVTNAGLNALSVIDLNMVFAAGNVSSATAVILKVFA